ncbi:MAG: SH3 domain-containing protein [Alphaproteobacteria bacterium]|nr:SH3 domain-containing protein [Alphaproteobacteria bacterium]
MLGTIPFLFSASLLLFTATAAVAQTGLPIPRFVSVRAAEANLRTGPGVRYPIAWVYLKRGLPMEIIAEFDTWRMVRDHEGEEGWLHQSLLSGKRTVLITAEIASLRRRPDETAPVVARAQEGVIADIDGCQGAWCEIEAGGFTGWVPRRTLWGVYPGETLD